MCRFDETPSVRLVYVYTLQKSIRFDPQLGSYSQSVKCLTMGHSTLLLDQIVLLYIEPYVAKR